MSKVFTFPCGCEFEVLDDTGDYPLLKFDPNPDDLNLDCPRTWQLIGEGNTKGVFQLESPLGRSWAKKLGPENMEQLSALVAILRPGCLEAMRDGKSVSQHYVDRKNGVEDVEYFHSSLEPLLGETFGEMIYQEQAMHIARDLAGFDLQQADVLRKAIGKKLPEVMKKVKGDFLEGCKQAKVVTDDEAEQIFGWIEKSQRYSFNKSHSVSYALNAYLSAYCKAHFKRAFFTSYLFYAKEKAKPHEEISELINNAKTMDVDVKPPDFRLLNEEFSVAHGNIYFGMFNIKGIGMSIVEKIVKESEAVERNIGQKREKWTWLTFLVHFSHRVTSTAVKNMIMSGALDYFGEYRNKMLYEYSLFSKMTTRELEWIMTNIDTQKSGTLLDAIVAVLNDGTGKGHAMANKPREKKVNEMLSMIKFPPHTMVDSDEWAASMEENLLGLPLTKSIVDSCDKAEANTTCIEAAQGKCGKYDLMFIACKVDAVKEIETKKKDKMAFLTVSDNTGQLESVVCFSDAWLKFKMLCTTDNTVMVVGKKGKNGRDNSVIVSKILQLTP